MRIIYTTPSRAVKHMEPEATFLLRLGAERIRVTATHRQMLALICGIQAGGTNLARVRLGAQYGSK